MDSTNPTVYNDYYSTNEFLINELKLARKAIDVLTEWEDAFTNLAVYICVAKSPAGLTKEEIGDALKGQTPEEMVKTCIKWVQSIRRKTTKGDK